MVVKEKMNVKFAYKKLDDTKKVVENLYVDQLWTSKDGHEIVSGFLHETGEGRAYHADRMTDVTEVTVDTES